jgi:hypothetical protein
MALSPAVKMIVTVGITMGLLVPGVYLMPRVQDLPAPVPPYAPPADQPAKPLANQNAWEAYTGQSGNWQQPLNRSLFTRNVTLSGLRVLSGEEAEKALNGSAARPPSAGTLDGAEAASGAYDQKGGGTGAPREVEEADIVKLLGSHLYVLNPYRGLIIVSLSDPDRPAVTGAVSVQGYPQDMYVVGNLAFIILTTTYGYWYNYYTLDAGRGGEVIDGVEVSLGTHIAVVNLVDKAAPKVVMRIPLPGFATDSRRVGDVIYAVTNSYAWTMYGSDNGGSYVTSVDFSEPSSVRRVGTLFFNGTSNQVHASPTAFFLAQQQYTYDPRGLDSKYSTRVTYIDISDPKGAIASRGTFSVAGALSNKYQMDHYGDTFRLVTHFWGSGGQLGSSTLTIYNVADPDSITKLGSLGINDAGTLMATRFAGTRAYTIHLPRSIDPLDVLDLSDPKHPRLTDILEMPGWVTHIEVRGTKLIALGVDDSNGKTNVAVSLFDVTDPANAVMKSRVRIGTGHTWSAANWEPKALSVVDEQNLVIVPFSSQGTDRYWGAPDNGIQLVEFDLSKMTLAAKGAVANSQPVSRTRSYGDRILATSDYALQVVNAQDRSNPKVVADIQFVWNIQDALPMGDVEVQLYSEGWEGATGLRIVKPGASDWDAPIAEVPLDLAQVSLFPDGKKLYILGTDGTDVRVLGYDFSDPASPKLLGTASTKGPSGQYPGGPEPPRKEGAEIMPSYIYYTLRSARLDNGVLAVMPDTYYGGQSRTVMLFDIGGGAPASLPDVAVTLPAQPYGGYSYINGFIGSGKTLYMTYWGTDSYFLRRVVLEDPAKPVQPADTVIKGELAGAAADGSAVYTTAYVYNYDGITSTYSYAFNIYRLDAQGATLAWSVQFDNQSITGARVSGGRAFLTLSSGRYYYGYGYEMGFWGDGDIKGGAPDYQPPRTDIVVLDLSASGPSVAGKLGLDGYAYIQEVAGNVVFVYGEGLLAAYEMGEGGLGFAGALALRGYVMKVRVFEGGALISEGMYGTEALVF